MELHAGVHIERDCWFVALDSEPQDDRTKIVIHRGAKIGMGATISAICRVEIGEETLLARNVYISDHTHGYEQVDIAIAAQGVVNVKAVSIGRCCWLGQNVCVLPGVTIGKHCVIGANSVVNTNIPDYCVAVGTPARVVKYYDSQSDRWMKGKPEGKS
jgi:acetyltransferase-like isoleucine patch superfamily enzyme